MAARADLVTESRRLLAREFEIPIAITQDHDEKPKKIAADFPLLLHLISQKRVGDRPDRCEPRAVKRRPKPYHLLTIPRAEAKKRIEGGEILYPRIKH